MKHPNPQSPAPPPTPRRENNPMIPRENDEAPMLTGPRESLRDDSLTPTIIAQTEKEQLWHTLAVQHQQRPQILDTSQPVHRKMDVFIELIMKRGGLP